MRKYINRNLTDDQRSFLLLLEDSEIEIFTEDKIEKQVGRAFENISQILSNLNAKNFLTRLEKG
ncbi:MAG: hypothetical protein ISS28_07835, partial [Candidatus Cloacimonetes bacterium]|nr:hypothetical protein [Candidatus Cloacimonadota bacterium]